MISAIIITIVLLIIIFSILTKKLSQFVIGLGGTCIVIISLIYLDNVSFAQVVILLVGENNFANLHTILFIFGMMIIITIAEKAGVFTYLAFKLVKKFGYNSNKLLYVLCTITFIFSALLSNLLCIFLLVPLTITICRIVRINPIPYIIAEAVIVNLGGLLFIISSVPTLLISKSIGWSFLEYFLDIGFFSIFMFFITLLLLNTYKKFKIEPSSENLMNILENYDAWIFVKDKRTFYTTSFILIATLGSIIIFPIFFNVYIEIFALIGGFLTIITTKNGRSKETLKNINISSVFYLTFILFISEALVFTGVLNFIIDGLKVISFGNSFLLTIYILWISSIMSSALNNAPVTNIWIPLVKQLSTPSTMKDLFSAVSIGAVLGENLGPMGDNLTLITNTRQYGYQLTYVQFVKIGFIATFIQLICATIFIIIKTNIIFMFIGVIILILLVIVLYKLHDIYIWFKNFELNFSK
jgi:Na+/H+ antiporter NhaD/arsenite permease-like protein